MIPKLVYVEWHDSHYFPGWHYGEPETEPKVCHSVGYLLFDGPRAVTIACTVTSEAEPQRMGEVTIPREAITAMRRLSVRRRPNGPKRAGDGPS